MQICMNIVVSKHTKNSTKYEISVQYSRPGFRFEDIFSNRPIK